MSVFHFRGGGVQVKLFTFKTYSEQILLLWARYYPQYFPFPEINIPHFCFFMCIVHFDTVRSEFALMLRNNGVLYISAVSLMNYEITGWRRLLLSNKNINTENRLFTLSCHVRSTRYTGIVLIKYKWRQYKFKGFIYLKNIDFSLYFTISDRHFNIDYVPLTACVYTYFQGESLQYPTGWHNSSQKLTVMNEL